MTKDESTSLFDNLWEVWEYDLDISTRDRYKHYLATYFNYIENDKKLIYIAKSLPREYRVIYLKKRKDKILNVFYEDQNGRTSLVNCAAFIHELRILDNYLEELGEGTRARVPSCNCNALRKKDR